MWNKTSFYAEKQKIESVFSENHFKELFIVSFFVRFGRVKTAELFFGTLQSLCTFHLFCYEFETGPRVAYICTKSAKRSFTANVKKMQNMALLVVVVVRSFILPCLRRIMVMFFRSFLKKLNKRNLYILEKREIRGFFKSWKVLTFLFLRV